MQVAMKRNVIRRRLIEPKSPADNESRDGGVQSSIVLSSLLKRWPKTMRDIG
jgi:hypothetical protein